MKNVSIRPNLNKKDELTIHNGKMGRKISGAKKITILCKSVTVRPSGNMQAVAGVKTVHASLNGDIIPFVSPNELSKAVQYRPHFGESSFTIDGEKFTGGKIITMIGWKAYTIE